MDDSENLTRPPGNQWHRAKEMHIRFMRDASKPFYNEYFQLFGLFLFLLSSLPLIRLQLLRNYSTGGSVTSQQR